MPKKTPRRRTPRAAKATRAPKKARPAPRRVRAKPAASKTREPTVTLMPVSRIFQAYEAQAEDWVRDRERLLKLTADVQRKMGGISPRKSGMKPVWKDLQTMVRLVEAHARGQAPDVPWNSVVLSTAALLYLAAPGDLVPDWTPRVGLADDAAVVGLVAETVRDDLRAFERAPRTRLR